ncbi:hypothetical protein RZS08_65835 [Arthrospira platensis SPKY1]|nr:hypothetical protein [Arthrospira platensis SPKY1]
MKSFILKRQPKSYNSWKGASNAKKESYSEEIYQSLEKYNPVAQVIKEDLYGTFYYFYKKDLNHDADN